MIINIRTNIIINNNIIIIKEIKDIKTRWINSNTINNIINRINNNISKIEISRIKIKTIIDFSKIKNNKI